MIYRFIIEGVPRTKKTSNQGVVIPAKGGGKPRAVMFPAKEWRTWVKEARIRHGLGIITLHQKRVLFVGDGTASDWKPLEAPMNCAARFYLGNRQHGDYLGYMTGLGDFLEARRVIANDRLIVSADGSRCIHDGSTPRVELTLESAP